MTEEQRRQAAAQRCADLANESGGVPHWEAKDFEVAGVAVSFLNAVLKIDELARIIKRNEHRLDAHFPKITQHILPEPQLSPVERLAKAWVAEPSVVSGWLDHLGLELRKKSS